MKLKILKILLIVAITVTLTSYIVRAAATFPTALNNFSSGDTIESEEWNAIEAKIGIDNSTVTTSLDYLLKSTSSSNPGHKHTLANGATDVTATYTELNIMDGVTASTAEINILDGATLTATELNYVDGVTSAIQTQLDAKSAHGSTIDDTELTAEDFGDWTSTGGEDGCTLDNDVVAAAEMADADHGDISWSGGTATVENVQCSTCIAGTEIDFTSVATTTWASASVPFTWTFDTIGTDPDLVFKDSAIYTTQQIGSAGAIVFSSCDASLTNYVSLYQPNTATSKIYYTGTALDIENDVGGNVFQIDSSYDIKFAGDWKFKSGAYEGTFTKDSLTANRSWTLPDVTGYVAIDATSVTDLEGTGLAISGGTLNFTSTEVATTTWAGGAGATWTFDTAGTDPIIAFSDSLINITGALTVSGTITGDLTGAVTGNADTATALATNPTACTNQFVTDLDADGTLTCASVASAYITNGTIAEDDLKVVNAAADEDIFTYESSTGDFEWHTPSELSLYYSGGTDVLFADGGTGFSSLTQYDIIFATTTTSFGTVGIGLANECLQINSDGTGYEWDTCGTGDITDVWSASTGDANQLTIGENEYLIGGAVDGTTDPYISLPQGADVSSVTGEGYISWDTDDDTLYVGTGAAATAIGAGDVTGVGDCASGACLDGTSDGGEYIRIYDGNSHYAELNVGDISANRIINLPLTTGTLVLDTLANLGTVAINTSLISDTDSTDDLGSSSKYWANSYIDSLYLNSGAILSGTSTAGTITSVGNIVPNVDSVDDLGSSSKGWENLYVDDTIYTDTINEDTAASGVTIDSMLIKDGKTEIDNITATTGARACNDVGQNDLTDATVQRVDFIAETYDIGSDFNVGNLVSGTADGDTTNHLIDSGADFVTDGVKVGYRVEETGGSNYSYVTAVTATDLTLRDDIFPNGNENYAILASRFVCPVTGYYFVVSQVRYASPAADKNYQVLLKKDDAYVSSVSSHPSNTSTLDAIVSDIVSCSANSYIDIWAYNNRGDNTQDITGSALGTFISIVLLGT